MPIAVTYNPLCDSAAVFEREVDGETLDFGVSGLLYNSNMLMFDRRLEAAGESLWSQLLGRAVAGPAAEAGPRLVHLACSLVTWADWKARHPQTTVIDRDPRMIKRYKETNYATYFQSSRLMFPVEPPPPLGGPDPKARVVAVAAGGERRVYLLSSIAAQAGSGGRWTDTVGGTTVRFDYRPDPQRVAVRGPAGDTALAVIHAFWFAWHASHPDDELY